MQNDAKIGGSSAHTNEPPRRNSSMARSVFSDAVNGHLRQLAEEALKAKYGNRKAEFARAIGISPPSLDKILSRGGGCNVRTARAICEEAGVDPAVVLGADMAGVKEPQSGVSGLDIAVNYHPGRWDTALVEACRVGLFHDEATPQEWTARLDLLSAAIPEIAARARR